MINASLRSGLACLALAFACAGSAWAQQSFVVNTDAAGLTTVSVDGKCNLTEAIQSLNLGYPVNSDCVSEGYDQILTLMGGSSATVYKVGSGVTITSQVHISAGANVTIEGTGTPITVMPNAFVSLYGPLTVRHKAGSAGRAISNYGNLTAYDVVFQGGDISGLSGEDLVGASGAAIGGYGGVLYSYGDLYLDGCTLQGGKAVQGGGLYLKNTTSGETVELNRLTVQNNSATRSGGGLYLKNHILYVYYSAFLNNTAEERGGGLFNIGNLHLIGCSLRGNRAGQGGGAYEDTPNGSYVPDFMTQKTTFSDNKALATEVTPIPGASGTVITGTGTQCSSSETPSQAFDDNFATKWCNTSSVDLGPNSPAILTYDFPGTSTQVVSAYSITSANDESDRDPADWTFEGYDGKNWIVLHTVRNFTFSNPKLAGNYQHFLTYTFDKYKPGEPFTNTKAYQAYQLRITRNAGTNPGRKPTRITQLAELQLYQDGKTGDGGGLYAIGHMNLENTTFSGNLAGCTSASCACASAWCATTSGTSPAMGKGGGIFAGDPPPESPNINCTVAGNSASQGGGVYADFSEHWSWGQSIFANNQSRTSKAPEPDFHGNPYTLGLGSRKGNYFGSAAGILVFPGNTDGQGLVLTGTYRDYVGDPKLNTLADNGGDNPFLHPFTHSLKSTSPARDLAPNVTFPSEDARGVSRPQGAGIDFGAYEYE